MSIDEAGVTRPWQFQLRTMFAIVTLVATACGWYAWAGGLLEGFRPSLLDIAVYACPLAVAFVRREHRALGLDFGIVQLGFCLSAGATAYFLLRAFITMSGPLPPQVEHIITAIVVWTFVVPVSLLVESLVLSRGMNMTGLRWFHWFSVTVATVNIGLLTYLSCWFVRRASESRW